MYKQHTYLHLKWNTRGIMKYLELNNSKNTIIQAVWHVTNAEKLERQKKMELSILLKKSEQQV